MKRNWKKLLALSLAIVLVLCACGGGSSDESEPTAAPDSTPTAAPVDTPAPAAERPEVNLAVLSGPTGVGAAKLWADSEAGLTANDYHVTLCTDNQQVMAGLTNGEFDIAAMATNVASTLYHKSGGAIQICAINTLGVLYILGPTDQPLTSLADLAGKTLYATGQGANPEYVLGYLLGQSGLEMGQDVEVVWQAAEEVTASMLSGEASYCMLPVPAATALEAKSDGKVAAQISLSEVWNELGNGSQLTMGCMVVRTEFAKAHPDVVAGFLDEYSDSIAYMADPASMAVSSNLNPAQLVADYGIAPNAAIAGKAMEQCNLVCIEGEAIRPVIQGYYEVLFAADPASIGGGIPDDAFYFLKD